VAEPLSNRAWSVPLVGRTGARAALRRWRTEASEGRFRVAAVTGPAGIGKSRMLAWVVDEHRRRGGAVWLGRCSPQRSPPFAPFVAALGERWPGLPRGASERPPHLAGSLDQPEPALHLVRAVAEVVIAEAEARPLVLALDDLQWADPGTLDLLEQLVYLLAARTGGCRVLVTMTARPPEPGGGTAEVLARVAREPAFRALALDPLDEVEVHELLRRLSGRPPDRRLVQRAHEASGGNPLGAVAAAEAGRVPDGTARPIVASEVAALGGAALRVALALAVDDRPTAISQVPSASGLAPDEAGEALDELDRARLVSFSESGDRCEVTSAHVMEAVLGRATTRERQAAHARIAALRRAGDGGEPDLVALAHHLERAGQHGAAELRAVARPAADRAFAAGAWGWAARLYELAIEEARSTAPGDVASLEERAGLACFRDFDTPRCEQHLVAAAELAQARGDLVVAGRAALWLLRRRFTSGTEAIGHLIDVTLLDRVLNAEDVPPDLRAQAHGLLAEMAFQANDLELAREHAAAATALASEVGEDLVGFWVATSEGLARLGVLELDEAAHAFREADGCVRRSGQDFVRAAGASRWAATEVLRGDLATADQLAGQAAADALEAANWSEHGLAESVRAVVAALRGRFDDHDDHAELAQVSCGRSSTTFTPLILLPVVAWGRAARGDRDGAARALADLDAAGGRSARYRLALEVMTEDVETVQKELVGYEWRACPSALTTYDAGAHAAQLELAIAVREDALVRAGCRLFEDLHARGVRSVSEWPVLVPRLVAEAKACLGERDDALRWCDEAERLAAAVGARVESARLAVLRAGLLLPSGDDGSVRTAVDLIDRATREFDALGMLRFARVAQQLFDLPPVVVDGAARHLRPRAVLFTDIVDSTAWNVRLGDDHWLVLMAEHNRLARREVRRSRGTVVKTMGDGIVAWFPQARDAVDCATSLQEAFEEFGQAHPDTPIRIRCGVAVGEVFDLDGDVAGLAVTQAARICAAAGASQVLTSEAARRLDDSGTRRYQPLGSVHLKGLPAAVPLFSVEPRREAAVASSEGGQAWG
jgi:class 3 adenylate cyclase